MTHDWFSHLEEQTRRIRRWLFHQTSRLRRPPRRPTRSNSAAAPATRWRRRLSPTPPLPRCSRPRRRDRRPRRPQDVRATTSRPGGTRRRSMATTSARSGASSVTRLIARSSTCVPSRTGETLGYLPVFGNACPPGQDRKCDPIQPEWAGQEATAFPDNWSIGMSFYHNLFVARA